MSKAEVDIALDVAAVSRIACVPELLRVACKTTKMGFAGVARVTEESWTACAVEDNIGLELQPGGQLDIHTTLCLEARNVRAPVVIDHASVDPLYSSHHTPRIYGIESYISVPIVLAGDEYFGNLFAIDRLPARPSRPEVVSMFKLFASLLAMHLNEERTRHAHAQALLDKIATGELRDQFIAVLGHDLRTPLSAVSSTAQLLCRSGNDPKVIQLAQRIRASSTRMAALIDDVLDLARGKLGGWNPNPRGGCRGPGAGLAWRRGGGSVHKSRAPNRRRHSHCNRDAVRPKSNTAAGGEPAVERHHPWVQRYACRPFSRVVQRGTRTHREEPGRAYFPRGPRESFPGVLAWQDICEQRRFGPRSVHLLGNRQGTWWFA